jgi:leucyl-tRNA synthetase
VLYDLGYVSTIEPFQRLVNQGMILGEDNQKMSKSRGNVVTPDDIIAEYGADSLRLFEMFMGPLEATKPWSMSGVEGVYRFLARVWRLAMEEDQEGVWRLSSCVVDDELTQRQQRIAHATIRKVTEDIESLSFNTAIAQMMIFVNEFTASERRPIKALRTLLILLNPFAPHLSEELWQRLGTKFSTFTNSVYNQPWPAWDEAHLAQEEIEIVIQVNGKLRDKISVTKDLDRKKLEQCALALPKVRDSIAARAVRKLIVVPNKIVNIVTD